MKETYTANEMIKYIKAIRTCDINKIYKNIIKPFENEYNDLYNEYDKVFDELKEYKERERNDVFDKNDANRYRKQNIELLKTINELRKENVSLKKEIKRIRRFI